MGKISRVSPELLTALRARFAGGLPPDIYSLSQEMRAPVGVVKQLPDGVELERLIEHSAPLFTLLGPHNTQIVCAVAGHHRPSVVVRRNERLPESLSAEE